MAQPGESRVFTTSLEAWNDLQRRGLDLREKPVSGYDVPLLHDMNATLYPASVLSLQENLMAKPPAVEHFIAAFLRAAQPFSMMVTDVLHMLEAAGAHAGESKLSIVFDFEAGARLGMSLEQFRRTQRILAEAVVDVPAWRFEQSPMWDVVRAATDVFELDNSRAPGAVRNVEIRAWLENYGQPSFFVPPAFPQSGAPRFDAALPRLRSLVQAFIEACIDIERDREAFNARAPWRRGEQPVQRGDDLFVANSDYWAEAFVGSIAQASEALAKLPPDERMALAGAFVDRADTALARLSTGTTSVTRLMESYRDILDLPLWKRRHELYAVWIAALATKCLPAVPLTFFTRDGELRFSFAPSKIASIGAERPVGFWTEVRSPLGAPSKVRTKGIQPDYRFLRHPYDLVEDTTLIVECKHYWKSSTSNFSAALNDYAVSCPNAQVVLVNNGPIGDAVQKAVRPDLSQRVHTVADLTPNHADAMVAFQSLVTAAVPIHEPTNEASQRSAMESGGAVTLEWTETLDLDLHLIVRSHGANDGTYHVAYSQNGTLDEFPWARLEGDVRRGPGIEKISIGRWLNADYDVYVHNFDGQSSPAHPDVQVTIARESHPDVTISGPPVHASGVFWHVCSIDGATGRLTARGTTSTTPPSA